MCADHLNLACDFVWVCSTLQLVRYFVYATDPVDAHHSICLNTAQRDMREWMRGKFVKALNVDMSCVRSLLEVL
jgi:hypothetical protein